MKSAGVLDQFADTLGKSEYETPTQCWPLSFSVKVDEFSNAVSFGFLAQPPGDTLGLIEIIVLDFTLRQSQFNFSQQVLKKLLSAPFVIGVQEVAAGGLDLGAHLLRVAQAEGAHAIRA